MHAGVPPTAVTGEAYAHQFSADFPHEPGFFIVTGGALPTGVTLDAFTGELTGFPRQVGSFTVEIAARDGEDKDLPLGRDVTFAEDRREFEIVVERGLPNILPQVVPAAQFHAGYSYQIDAAGGYPPYTFEQVGGDLPAGLTVFPTGELAGFPDEFQPLPYEFTVRITDSIGQTDTENLSVQVFVLPLVIDVPVLPTALVDEPYDVLLQLASPGGGAPYFWEQAPLQPGDNVDLDTIGMEISADGHLRVKSGFPGPTSPGNYVFSVQVTDDAGQVETAQLSLKVVLGPVLTSITPKTSTSPGPFIATGANFQPGATLVFKPGPTEQVVFPTFISSTTLSFPTAPPKPGGAGGVVSVRVDNLDGGKFLLPNAFVFPANSITFGSKGQILSSLSSTGLDCADLNGDGRADVVHCGASGATNYPQAGGITSTAGGLVLLMNGASGTPTFTPTTLDTGNFYDCEIADVNNDTKPDIVGLTQTSVKVWLNGVSGNPLGVFTAQSPSTAPTVSFPSGLTLAYINGDSVLDIAYGNAFNNIGGSVYTLFGNGSGGFTSGASSTSGIPYAYGVIALAALDLNGDGRADIAAGSGWRNSSGNEFSVSLTTPSNTFGAWSSVGSGLSYGNTLGVVAADFFGNGTPCIAVAHSQDQNDGGGRKVTLYSGSTLTSATALPAPAGGGTTTGLGKCLTAIDGDFDAKIDLALSTHPGTVQVYRMATNTLATTLDIAGGSPSATGRSGPLASGDLDGDGREDLLVTTSYWSVDYQPNIYGATWALNIAGNGSPMGIIFWLNSSN
jgi:hypothetical protein